jgi:hypothetical protein
MIEGINSNAAIVLRMAVRGEYADAADASGDGKVTSLDALILLQAGAACVCGNGGGCNHAPTQRRPLNRGDKSYEHVATKRKA